MASQYHIKYGKGKFFYSEMNNILMLGLGGIIPKKHHANNKVQYFKVNIKSELGTCSL
jgi:hypothetical protein